MVGGTTQVVIGGEDAQGRYFPRMVILWGSIDGGKQGQN